MSKQTAEQIKKCADFYAKTITDDHNDRSDVADHFIAGANAMLAASPSPGWIKASERLPAPLQQCFLIIHNQPTFKMIGRYDKKSGYFKDFIDGDIYPIEIVEWLDESMLFQSPAKPEGEGKGGDLVCDHCNGMGQRMSGGDSVECEQCGGDGEYVLSYDEVCNELRKTNDLLDTSIFLLKGIAQDMNTGGEHQSAEWLQKSISEIISKK